MRALTPPKIGTAQASQKEVEEIIAQARAYFADHSVLRQIDEQVGLTQKWMRRNSESFNADGSLAKTKPWWPLLKHTDCPVLLATRKRLLLDRVYEHGILHFLYGLAEVGVIGVPDEYLVDLVIDSMTPVVLNQLIARRYANGVRAGVSLSTLSVLFGNGRGTNPTKLRGRIVARLCPIGLFSARFNEGYDIAVGAVGEAFYTRVYVPIADETQLNPER